MAPPARYSQAHRDLLSGQLLLLLREFAERGEYPSVRLICDRLAVGEDARPSDHIIRDLRDELEDLGLWARPAYWPRGKAAGLDGSTPESRKAIELNRVAILAEKIGRGELPGPPPELPGPLPRKVYHWPDCRPREDRR